MKVRDVQQMIEQWAPPDLAWERDNPGLQVGDPDAQVRGIIVALDPTEQVVAEARRRGASLVVTHHPLLFRPLRSVTTRRSVERTVLALARYGMAAIAAHTNLDFTEGGTSHALADRLGVLAPEFLRRPFRTHAKIVTFVPPSHVAAVADAMSGAGAGVIGGYDRCSFRTDGTGTFRGGPATSPVVGSQGLFERVPEVRLEMLVPRRSVGAAVEALRAAHPYEEPAYDLYHLENLDTTAGMGVVGTLPAAEPFSRFLGRIRRLLGTRALRYAGDPRRTIRRVALCGGGGAELLDDAVNSGADVYVTADVSYHVFHEAAGRIALVDAGHYETEFPVVGALVAHLRAQIASRGGRLAVNPARTSTNPVGQSV
jgi:dinuclear metal center YbgI/SA1388 family protein